MQAYKSIAGTREHNIIELAQISLTSLTNYKLIPVRTKTPQKGVDLGRRVFDEANPILL